MQYGKIHRKDGKEERTICDFKLIFGDPSPWQVSSDIPAHPESGTPNIFPL
jgi:hypothetical protein